MEKLTSSPEDKKVLEKFPTQCLADTSNDSSIFCPDIVISRDYFWNLVTLGGPGVVELPSGLFIIPSKLGFLIGGMDRSVGQKSSLDVHAQFSGVVSSTKRVQRESLFIGTEPSIDHWKSCSPLSEVMNSMESLEAIGIKDSPFVKDDDIVMDLFRNDSNWLMADVRQNFPSKKTWTCYLTIMDWRKVEPGPWERDSS